MASKRGFTFFEILIAVSLFGLLMGGSLTLWQGQIIKGQDAARKSDLEKLSTAFEHFYNDRGCYPTQMQWNSVTCESTPDFLKPYVSTFPCDPTAKTPYAYQTTDTEGNACTGDCGACYGYRLLAPLKITNDPQIRSLGCDGNVGCGFQSVSNLTYNYGVSKGVALPAVGFVAPPVGTEMDKNSVKISCKSENAECIINQSLKDCCSGLTCVPFNESSGNGKCQTVITPTPTVQPTGIPTPTPTMEPTICVPYDSPAPPPVPFTSSVYWSTPADSGNTSTHFNFLLHALEWYKRENGSYPTCGCPGWAKLKECLLEKLDKYRMPQQETLMGSPFQDIYIYAVAPNDEYTCVATQYSGWMKTFNLQCPIAPPSSKYTYLKRGNGQIEPKTPWSNYITPMPTPLDRQADTKRKSDVAILVNALSNYKKDNGFFPKISMGWSEFINIRTIDSYLRPKYLYVLPADPRKFEYDVNFSNKDANGNWQSACVMSYMENNESCENKCGIPVVYWFNDFCYGEPVP